MTHFWLYSRDIILAALLAFLAKVWTIVGGYILTHYIIDGVIHHTSEWLKRHPIEHAIVRHYKDKHKKNNPADRTPQECEQGYCVIVPIK